MANSDCVTCGHSRESHVNTDGCEYNARSGFVCKCAKYRKHPGNKFFIYISELTDKPIAVTRDMARAVIYPDGEPGKWIPVQTIPSTRLQILEDRLHGLHETMRPLLDEWHKLAREEGRL